MKTATRTTALRRIVLGAITACLISSGLADAHPWRRINPPGAAGGPGANWRNPPGPVGGPGVSRYRGRVWRDRHNNPPGPRGGRGTNWENPPGRRGGPGTSPDRRRWR